MHGLRRRLVFLVVLTVGVLAIAGAAHAHGVDHHGHPGTVKVDDDDIDDGNANHPHVICGLAVVVTRGFGAPFDIDFVLVSPTMRAGNDQRLLIVHVPDGDDVRGLIDLRAVLGGIAPHPVQGFHLLINVRLPGGGEKHKVIWVLKDCPPGTPQSGPTTTVAGGTTTTTAKNGTTTTTAKAGSTTTSTSTTVAGIVTPGTGVPTQVLGEQFTNPAAAATAPAPGTDASALASTGLPFPPALAFLLIATGIILGGTWRAASGRKLEESLRGAAVKERGPRLF
jgi:hypothetical protein